MKISEWVLKLQDKVSGTLAKVSGAADHVAKKFTGLQDKMRTFENSAKSSASKIGGWLVAAGLIGGIGTVTSKIFELTASHQKYQAVLTNSLGSQRASNEAMKMLQDFSKQTPFQMNEITESYTKMVNRGMIPTKKELTSMGDLAASSGKSIDQLTEAVLDAQTGEFERLKEFGVKASVNGDKVTFMFKNQATTVANNADAINKYVMGLGNVAGVQGSMASQMNTLGGKVSNLQDSFATLLLSLGEKLLPLFDWAIGLLGTLIDNAPLVTDALVSIATAVGILAAGFAVYKIQAAIATVETWSLNAAFAANPIMWVAAALAVLVAGIVYAWKRFEWFRGIIYGVWEAAKTAFKGMADIAWRYLSGVGDLIAGIFTLDIDQIKKGMKSIASSYTGVVDLGKDIGEKFQNGYNKGVQEVRDRAKVKDEKNTNPLTGASLEDVRAKNSAATAAAAKTAAKAKKGIDGVAGGGSQVRNVSVVIQTLAKDTIINVATFKGNPTDVQRFFQEELVRATIGLENVLN